MSLPKTDIINLLYCCLPKAIVVALVLLCHRLQLARTWEISVIHLIKI